MARAGTITILSIDGGGIRGVIPAMILTHIENRTGLPVYRLFDLVAGTSTGGIIALGLTKPNADGVNEYSAEQMVDLFKRDGPSIFPHTFWAQVRGLDGWHDERYPSAGIDQTLQRLAGDARLKHALTKVLVTSYDIERRNAIFFKSWMAAKDDAYDFYIRDVARATSAAPTYFEPHKIQVGEDDYYSLVDGGVVAGNPTLCALVDARDLFQGSQFFILSLGTGQARHSFAYDRAKDWGKIGWAQPMIDIFLDASNHQVDYQVAMLQKTSGTKSVSHYFRLQPHLDADSEAMDDASSANMRRLSLLTESFINETETGQQLQTVCDELVRLKSGDAAAPVHAGG